MSTSLNPVAVESNFPGLTITSANAYATEILVGPIFNTQNHERIPGDQDTLRATMEWTYAATPPLAFVLSMVADWHSKAILQNLETGVVTTKTKTEEFTMNPTVTMPMAFDDLTPGIYRLYVTSQLQVRGTGRHLAVALSSEGATFTVYDSAFA